MAISLEVNNAQSVATIRALEVVGGLALAVVAGIHLMDLSSKFSEVPYLGVGYFGLIVGAVASMVLLVRRDHRGWLLGGGLALATIVGFVLSRTTGLPASTDDIGNWSEPLGIVALLAEAIVVALAARALRSRKLTMTA
jgi:hypothetical protein